MKMVSAAKYSRAEQELRAARPYGEGSTVFYEKMKLEEKEPAEGTKLLVAVAVTADRGLSGAIHTSVSRQIRNELAEKSDNVKVVCIGDKSRSILQRLYYGKNVVLEANEIGRKPLLSWTQFA